MRLSEAAGDVVLVTMLQEDVQVARWILEYVLDDSPAPQEAPDRDPDQASDEEGGSPRAPL